MPVLDAVFVGQIHLPYVSTGPLPPGPGMPPTWGGGGQPSFPVTMPPIYYPPYLPTLPNPPPPVWGGGGQPGPFPPPGTWGGVAPPGYITGGPGWLPQPPLGIWGGRPPPYVDIGLPGPQPIPGWPPVVMPPIYYPPAGSGGSPPGFWGGSSPWPGWATPPIYIPIPPGEQPPEPGNGLTPSNPIYIPGESGPGGVKALVHVYVAGVGGVWFLIDVPPPAPPAPTHPIVTPEPPATPRP
jgi:hypothetical protein